MKKQLFFPLSFFKTRETLTALLVNELTRAAGVAVAGWDGIGDNPATYRVEFVNDVKTAISNNFFNPYAITKYAFAAPVDAKNAASVGEMYANYAASYTMGAWADRVIKAETIKVWVYLRRKYAVEEAGVVQTSTETETNAQGTNEQANNGTTRQKFTAGGTTATSGTSNLTENKESATGLTTGKTTSSQNVIQGYVRDYAGKPDDLIAANMNGAGVVERLVASFSSLLIDLDTLDADEIADDDIFA